MKRWQQNCKIWLQNILIFWAYIIWMEPQYKVTFILGGIHKLCWKDEVGRWTEIVCKLSLIRVKEFIHKGQPGKFRKKSCLQLQRSLWFMNTSIFSTKGRSTDRGWALGRDKASNCYQAGSRRCFFPAWYLV